VNPLNATRRTGDAWDVAQNSAVFSHGEPVDGAGKLIVRFDSERQKLFSAVHSLAPSADPEHWLNESTAPLMTTSPGDDPRPATVV
jgi:hypothetical protein